MRLVKARPLVEEVALSGFGEDDELGRHGRRGARLRRRPREDEDGEEVAGRSERRARRKLRREQRSERQSLRARQKLQKSRGGRRAMSRRGDGESRVPASVRRPSHSPEEPEEVEDFETTEESDTPSRPRRRQMRRPMPRPHRADRPDEDDFLDDPFEEDLEDEIEDEALEGTRLELGRAVRRGILAPGSARKVMERVRSQLREGRERRQQRRSPEQPAPQPTATPGWSPPGSMGHNLRVQARIGHRAAVMELREGLYLVADISSEAMLPSTQGEEVGAILPALMVRAAAKAIQNRRQSRNALDALQPRQLPGPTAPPLQLHGPIAGCAWSD